MKYASIMKNKSEDAKLIHIFHNINIEKPIKKISLMDELTDNH